MNGINKSAAAVLLALSSLPLHAAPNTEGVWSGVKNWPLIPIHAVLTPDGKIFTWGTDSAGEQGAMFSYDVWNPNAGTGTSSHQTLPNTLGVDSFCSAGMMLPTTGDLMMAGGDARPFGSKGGGINTVVNYSPGNSGLSNLSNMNYARWYPTATMLSNGEILIAGGRDVAKVKVVTPEIYTPWTNQWRSLFGALTSRYNFWYPRMWVIPDGRVFSLSIDGDLRMYYMDTNGSGSIWDVGTVPFNFKTVKTSPSAMYQPGKILLVAQEETTRRLRAVTIDVNGAQPIVREVAAPNLSTGRLWANMTILPDGKLMLVGGSSDANKLDNVSYRAEIWDPATERWSTMGAHVKAKLYHSTALLMQDGRVLVGGGGAPGPQVNTNAEIFSPPYLYNSSGAAASRPRITSAPKRADYGAWISVSSSSSNPISRVTLVKTGSVTHSNNMEQRFIELNFGDRTGGVNVGLPSSSAIATPGYYMIFLIDNKGVPSKGHMINLGGPAVVANEALVARPDWVNASGSRITIDPLSNDGGSGLRLIAPNAYSLQGGNVALSNNKLTYKAKPGFNGTDKIWYSARDSQGAEAWSEITITVSGNAAANPYPVGNADSTSAIAGAAKTIDVLANDVGNGLVLVAPNAWSLQGGNVALVNNKLRYTAKSSYNGQDKIWYTFRDVEGRQGWGEVTINVSGGVASNPYPVGKPDWFNASSGVRKTLNVLANDVGNGLVLNPLSSAYSLQGGNVSLSNNAISYRSKSGFRGEDKIWYSLKDVEGRGAWGEVTVNVQ